MAQTQNSCELLVDESFLFKEITWRIPQALSLPRFTGYEARSPEFSFANGTWILCLYPDGQHTTKSGSFIDISLNRLWSLEAEQRVYFKIFLKTSKGKEFEAFTDFYDFSSVHNDSGVCRYLQFSRLVGMQKLLAPQGTLTIVCQMRTKNAAIAEATSRQKVVKPVQSAEALGEAAKNCKNSIEVCTQTDNNCGKETHREAVKDCKNSIEVCTQTEDNFGFEREQLIPESPGKKKIVSDYEELLLSGDDCDVMLLVKGQKFEAHRAILRARSPVFACMLKHDMKENNTGRIDISDCDPEHFPDFLHFLYCGSVDSITSQNACSLYKAADKYHVQDLKSECFTFIKSHISVDNFCDVITLALQHTEAELVKQATDFFAKNLPKIILTVKWQLFLAENPTESNELLIKALATDRPSSS